MATLTTIYITCCICIFVFVVITAIEDEFLKRKMIRKYKDSGIGYVLITVDSPREIAVLLLVMLVISFVPLINLVLFIFTYLYRKGLM